MKEQLISLKTAKLAKEKGFNLSSPAFYGCDNPSSGNSNQLIWRTWVTLNNLGDEESQEGTFIYSAPYQHMLQKWLREEHKIFLTVHFISSSNYIYYRYYVRKLDRASHHFFDQKFGEWQIISWEDTLEEGLYESLKLIE